MSETAPATPLRILLAEDVPTDAELVERELRGAGVSFVVQRAARRQEFAQGLEEFAPDVVLADFKLIDFDGLEAVKMSRERLPDVPVILVTGVLSAEAAVQIVKAGAFDFVLKDRLARLPVTLEHALEEAAGRRRLRRAAEAEHVAQLRYRRLFEAARDAIFIVDFETRRVMDVNPYAVELLGYTVEECRATGFCDLLLGNDPEVLASVLDELERSGFVRMDEVELRTKDGRAFFGEIATNLYDVAGRRMAQCSIRDVSERVNAERHLSRVRRALRTLSAGNSAIVHAGDEKGLLDEMCRVIAEKGGYALATIAVGDDDAAKTARILAFAGAAADYLDNSKFTWSEDSPNDRGPTGAAIRTGGASINQDFATNPAVAPWRDEALAHNLHSSAAFPVHLDGKRGALTMYSVDPAAFDTEESALLSELAEDLEFGVQSLHVRAERDETLHQLQENMGRTIEAIGRAVALRDPYTGGHQRRTAQLAVAIAEKMGMRLPQVQAIRFSALVHDVGRVYVPAEILTKPGKLTELEFDLVKVHPQAGAEILRAIDFPWPVSTIVVQHHERLDGSGYPNGLKGDAILPEARVLAVADVMEAMVSHRPYRPARTVQEALDELRRGRGTLFDPDVVDACASLFPGFTFD